MNTFWQDLRYSLRTLGKRPHFSLTDRGSRWLMVMGRLKPGATVDEAQTNVGSIARDLERAYPHSNDRMGVAVY